MLHPITSNCNQNCVFCSAWGRIDEKFNLNSFIKEISSDKDALITISGGEPFTVGIDNLIYIANFVSELGKKLELQTNALTIMHQEIKKLKILVSILNKTSGYFNINLSAHNSFLDCKVSGVKNGFKNRVNGIKILKKIGAKIRITYVINTFNYKFIPDFSRFVIKEIPFIDWVQFSYTKGIGKAKKNKSIIPPYSKVSKYLLRGFDILDKNKINFNVDHIPLCFLGDFYYKHVDINKLKNKIKGDYLKEKSKIKICFGCGFYKICSGPRKDYIEIYGKL